MTYNPYWADDLMEMQNGRYHFENLTNMAEQRVNQLRQQLDDRRSGRGGRGDPSGGISTDEIMEMCGLKIDKSGGETMRFDEFYECAIMASEFMGDTSPKRNEAQ